MKIKKLVIENINSLYGHFEIDFDSPALSQGIFAITGPTGSGKSTILDAICLALFGITPRLKSGERSETLSKGAKKSLAELTFEVSGKEFLVNCSMTPSSTKHTISCGGTILEDSLRKTPEKVKEIIGMDMEQFCRAALLAQGKFDAFLEAGVKEKADILEQITGTEIYSKIAGKANDIFRELKKQLEKEEAVSQAWHILDKEVEDRKRSELEELKKQNAEFSQKCRNLEILLRLFEKILSAEKNLETTRLAQERLVGDKTAFAEDARRLAAGEKADRIMPVFKLWDDCRKEHQANCVKIENLKISLPGLEERKNASFKRLQEIQGNLAEVKKTHEALMALIENVLLLDNTLHQKKEGLEILQRKISQGADKAQQLTEQLKKLEDSLKALEEEKKILQSYLDSHSADAELAAKKARWQEQMNQVTALQEQERVKQNELKKLKAAGEKAVLEAQQKKSCWENAVSEHKKLEQICEQKKSELADHLQGKPLEAWEQELALHQENLLCLRKIHSYEEERKMLADGHPCPLCGSLEHPFALGNIPQMTEKEKVIGEVKKVISAIRKKMTELEEINQKLNSNALTCTRLEGEYQLAEKDVQSKQKEAGNLEEQLQSHAAELSQLVAGLSENLAAAGFEWKDISRLPDEIDRRIVAYAETVSSLAGLDQKSNTALTNKAVVQKQQGENAASMEELSNEAAVGKEEIEKLSAQRFALFGTKDPAAEREGSLKQVEDLSKICLKESNGYTRELEEWRIAAENLSSIEKLVEDQQKQLEKLREDFEQACSREEMTLESFSASVLEGKELTRLVEIRSNLETRTRTLQENKDRYSVELAELQKDFPTDFEVEKSRQDLAGAKEQSDILLQQIGALNGELESNENMRKLQREQLAQLEALKQKYAVWSELDTLIGGGNGFRFKKIVQRLTLDNLLANANGILKRMNRRYGLLQRDGTDDPLIIDVIDHWQGSNIRPCGNLSGGERFQVSLALALGLSAMAGEKIRIDSLFLDEGFGTLDPEALKNALQTLAALQHTEGKTVGIISHVQTIAENIAAVIEVTPLGGGCSRLSGSGVTFRNDEKTAAGKRKKKKE